MEIGLYAHQKLLIIRRCSKIGIILDTECLVHNNQSYKIPDQTILGLIKQLGLLIFRDPLPHNAWPRLLLMD